MQATSSDGLLENYLLIDIQLGRKGGQHRAACRNGGRLGETLQEKMIV